jgi:hypothetical protein
VTVAALQRKVELLEKAVLQLRFQIESSHTGVAGADSPVTFGAKEFAARVGRSPAWVRREIACGRLKACGRPVLIPGSEILRFL